jgi:hypothetical protein
MSAAASPLEIRHTTIFVSRREDVATSPPVDTKTKSDDDDMG